MSVLYVNMDDIFKDAGIDNARNALSSLNRKADRLFRDGPEDFFGVKPASISKRPARAEPDQDVAASARRNIAGGPQIAGSVNLQLPSDDSHITGRVGGLFKGKVKAPTEYPERHRTKKEAILRPTSLHIPLSRSKRPMNAEGATSFHFAHEPISKTHEEKTSVRGTKTRSGSASDHVLYIEREGAVAVADNHSRDDAAKHLNASTGQDVADANQLGMSLQIRPDDIFAASVHEHGNAKQNDFASTYIEREDALAHTEAGTAVLFTNISEIARERHEFWKLVEKKAPEPSPDKMTVTIGHHEFFWKNVAGDEDCPTALSEALAKANPKKEFTVTTADNRPIRKIMFRHGWRPPEKRPVEETKQQQAERKEREEMSSRGAKFIDGRGGRTQFRIVGELPYDVPQAARVRILEGFSAEFRKRGLPFIAVMHAPDHTNDDRNWHFHLVYHDRPAKRFTGRSEDHQWELSEKPFNQELARHQRMTEALSEEHKEAMSTHIGKWDFTVPYTYRQKCGHKKTAFPFAQNKNRDANRKNFVPRLRQVLTDLTNSELQHAGVKRRLDPRRYSEMGIHKKTEDHLGTTSSQLENLGIPTVDGISNEQKQWAFLQEQIDGQIDAGSRSIDLQMGDWNSSLVNSRMNAQDAALTRERMARWKHAKRIALEHRRVEAFIREQLERMESRAQKVESVTTKHIAAIAAQKASKRQIRHLGKYQQKRDEARQYLAWIADHTSDERLQIAKSLKVIDIKTEETGRLLNNINRAIALTGAQSKPIVLEKAQPTASKTMAPSIPTDAVKAEHSVSPIVENAPSSSLKPSVDSFLRQIVKMQRRLVEKDDWIIPNNPSLDELTVIRSQDYPAIQHDLRKILGEQEEDLNEVLVALKYNPGLLEPKTLAEGRTQMDAINKRFNLQSKDEKLKSDFIRFADEPELVALLKQIEAKRIAEPDADLKAVGSQSKAAPKLVPTEKVNLSTMVSRAITVMRENHLRPHILERANGLQLEFRDEDVVLFDIPQLVQINEPTTCKRVRGIQAKHDRAINRLTSFLEKYPDRAVLPDGGTEPKIPAGLPPELQDIARAYARDPILRKALHDAAAQSKAQTIDNSSRTSASHSGIIPERVSQSHEEKSDKAVAPAGFRYNSNGILVMLPLAGGPEVGGARNVTEDDLSVDASKESAQTTSSAGYSLAASSVSDDHSGVIHTKKHLDDETSEPQLTIEQEERTDRAHQAYIQNYLRETEHKTVELERDRDGIVWPRNRKHKDCQGIDFSQVTGSSADVLQRRFALQEKDLEAIELAWKDSLTDKIELDGEHAILGALPANLYRSGQKWLSTNLGDEMRARLRHDRKTSCEKAIVAWRSSTIKPATERRVAAKVAVAWLKRSNVELETVERKKLFADLRAGIAHNQSPNLHAQRNDDFWN